MGAEYQVSEKVNWGAGFNYQPVSRDQDDMSDTDFFKTIFGLRA